MRAGDGCELWTEESGSGAPLILCHGGPGLWDMFGALAAELASNFRVIRWDQRGAGRSSRVGPYVIDRFLADLDEIRAHFGFAKCALLGHSWGAQLALRYALAFPDRLDALIYVSGTGLGRDWHPHYERNLAVRLGADRPAEDPERAIHQWTADFADPVTARQFAETMAVPWFEVNYECNRALNAEDKAAWQEAELLALCRKLLVPTLIVDGRLDIRPNWSVDSLAGALPNAQRVTLDTGHLPWVERPAEFRRVVLGWFRSRSVPVGGL